MDRLEDSPDYLGTGKVAREFGVTTQTVVNWIQRGTLLPGGGRLRLRAVQIGGRYYTHREWLDAYIASLEGRDEPCKPAETEPKRQKRFKSEKAAAMSRLGL